MPTVAPHILAGLHPARRIRGHEQQEQTWTRRCDTSPRRLAQNAAAPPAMTKLEAPLAATCGPRWLPLSRSTARIRLWAAEGGPMAAAAAPAAVPSRLPPRVVAAQARLDNVAGPQKVLIMLCVTESCTCQQRGDRHSQCHGIEQGRPASQQWYPAGGGFRWQMLPQCLLSEAARTTAADLIATPATEKDH